MQVSALQEKVWLGLPHVLAEKTRSTGNAEGAGAGGGVGSHALLPIQHTFSASPAPHQAADPSPTLTILSEIGGGL